MRVRIGGFVANLLLRYNFHPNETRNIRLRDKAPNCLNANFLKILRFEKNVSYENVIWYFGCVLCYILIF